jgi:hypothetical protein
LVPGRVRSGSSWCDEQWRGLHPHPNGCTVVGQRQADFWPIKCGGGIVFPHRDTRPETDVCPDCLAGTVTM